MKMTMRELAEMLLYPLASFLFAVMLTAPYEFTAFLNWLDGLI